MPLYLHYHKRSRLYIRNTYAICGKIQPNDLEMLVRKIYQCLRQQLELERERHSFYSGRLPW